MTSILTRDETADKLVYAERLRSYIKRCLLLRSTILRATQILRLPFSRTSSSRLQTKVKVEAAKTKMTRIVWEIQNGKFYVCKVK